MYSNQHAAKLKVLSRKAGLIHQDMKQRQSEMEWHRGFDVEQVSGELAILKRDMLADRQRIAQIDTAIESNTRLQGQCQGVASTWLSSLWRSSDESVAQRQAEEYQLRLKNLQLAKREAQAQLKGKVPDEERLESGLHRYRAFNPVEAQAIIGRQGEELSRLEQCMEESRVASERWEEKAGEVHRQWREAVEIVEQTDRDYARAEAFEQNLSMAASKLERALIHEACQGHFQSSRPKDVMRELSKKRIQQARDVEKREERLRNVISLLDKQIGTLIIDGNNLCYAPAENGKSQFIGLVALQALVPYLSEQYEVKVIFDPGIRKRLAKTDAELRALFPEANVTVARSGANADENILGAAEFDPAAFIISNDRFSDYPEQLAVRERRVLTHLIHPHSVQVQQLQINVPF